MQAGVPSWRQRPHLNAGFHHFAPLPVLGAAQHGHGTAHCCRCQLHVGAHASIVVAAAAAWCGTIRIHFHIACQCG